MPNQVYEGKVSVYDKDKKGNTLTIGKGDRKGEPYYKLSFQLPDDSWVNLMDFEGVTGGQKGEYHVEYFQKFLTNGEPDLYNGELPQFQLVDIYPLQPITPAAAQEQAKSASPQAQATPTPSGHQKSDFDPNLSRRQTAANDATRIVAAILSADPNADVDLFFWTTWADGIEAWLSGKTIEQHAEEKLGATPLKDDDELGFDDDGEPLPF